MFYNLSLEAAPLGLLNFLLMLLAAIQIAPRARFHGVTLLALALLITVVSHPLWSLALLAFLWLAQVWRAKTRRQWQQMPSAQRFFSLVVPPLAAINAWVLISSFLGPYKLASQIGFLLLLVVGALALLGAQFWMTQRNISEIATLMIECVLAIWLWLLPQALNPWNAGVDVVLTLSETPFSLLFWGILPVLILTGCAALASAVLAAQPAGQARGLMAYASAVVTYLWCLVILAMPILGSLITLLIYPGLNRTESLWQMVGPSSKSSESSMGIT